MKTKIITFIVPGVILLIFFLGLNSNNSYDTSNLIGKKINSFTLNLIDKEYSISENTLIKNKFTLINFWASWCYPCRLEHKYLVLLKNKNLKILGINFKDKKENALKFLSEMGNPYYYLAEDKNGKNSVKFGAYGIPESILVDHNLTIIKKYIGPIDKSDYENILMIIKD